MNWMNDRRKLKTSHFTICDTLYNYSILSQSFHFCQHNSHAKMPLNLFFVQSVLFLFCKKKIRNEKEKKAKARGKKERSVSNVFHCDCMLKLFNLRADTFVVIIDHKTKLNRKETSAKLVIRLKLQKNFLCSLLATCFKDI